MAELVCRGCGTSWWGWVATDPVTRETREVRYCPSCGRLLPRKVVVDVGKGRWEEDEVEEHVEDDHRGGPYFLCFEHAGHWYLCDEGRTWRWPKRTS